MQRSDVLVSSALLPLLVQILALRAWNSEILANGVVDVKSWWPGEAFVGADVQQILILVGRGLMLD